MTEERKVIAFGGQGNVTESSLQMIVNKTESIQLLAEIKQVDEVAYDVMYKLMYEGRRIEGVYQALLSTFFYNEYYVRTLKETHSIKFATSHSAGIFNLALFSGMADLKSVLSLLKKRADLMTSRKFEESMFYFICPALDDLKLVIEENKHIDVCLSIITDEASGVIAGKKQDIQQLKTLLNDQGMKLVLKESSITVPYHTKYLQELRQDYKKMIDEASLRVPDGSDLTFIFENNDSLPFEMFEQLTEVFNWREIKRKMIDLELTDVYDTSPNKFITKQLKKLKVKATFH